MQEVTCEKKGHVGVVTLNSPETNNRLTQQFAKEGHEALQNMQGDPETRVVVLRGAGKSFCAGVDVKGFMRLDSVGRRGLFYGVGEFVNYIAGMSKPVIVAVQGACVAAGVGLVATCDLAIAAEDAQFGCTGINVGLFCTGPSAPLSRSIGRKKALELLLTGDIIGAHEAERIGLVNRVVRNEDLDRAVLELGEKLANKSPIALQLGRRSFYQQADMPYSAAIDYLNQVLGIISCSEDASEGVGAFLDKREPHWRER